MKNKNGQGLAAAERYYRDYGCRARELKAEGKKIMGYVSALGPLEIITAAGLVPIRMKGEARDPITKADSQMETIVCPFVRSVFDSALKGRYDYLDGIVIPHTCDSFSRTYDVWRLGLRLPYAHFLNVPHVTDDASLEFFKEVLGTFVKSVETFTGRKVTDEALSQAVRAHNQNREAMRQLYALRKFDPPLISGVEMTKTLTAAMSLPVEESTDLIQGVMDEVSRRQNCPVKKGPRILIVGDQIDDPAIIELVERAGASVVMDDTSTGSKIYWPDVEPAGSLLDGIAQRYLRKVKLPTFYKDTGGTYQDNLAERFGHLGPFIRDFRIDGVLLLIYRCCDPYGFEVPAIKSYIEALKMPVLYLEDEYSTPALARLKTRIEAFLEMIGS